MSSDNRNRFLQTYNGNDLLQKYSLDEFGIWQIVGEDPNCDMGGYHHQPDLGNVEGTLSQAIDYAVNLVGFWQWGAGGNIKKLEIKRLDNDPNCCDVI